MRRRVVLLLAAVLLVAGAGVAWIDQGIRSAEDEALADCAERAEAAAIRADQVMGSMAEYIRPALAVTPSLWSLMEEAAADAQQPVEAALATCREVDVLGLHRVLTGLDRDSIEMREVSPMGGLLPQDEAPRGPHRRRRRKVLPVRGTPRVQHRRSRPLPHPATHCGPALPPGSRGGRLLATVTESR